MIGGVGLLRPAYCTGLGKVLLAYMTSTQLARYLAGTELKPLTANTITEPEILRRQLEEIRQNGLAFDDGELDKEVRCLGAPVRDFTSEVVAVVGISGPMWRLQLQALSEKAAYVRKAGAQLSAMLGYRPENNGEV